MPALNVDQLLGELTLEEKVSLTLGSDFWHTAPVERLDIPAIMLSDGPHGLRAQLAEADHVGLGGSVPATCFPTASALGSSWNPDLFADVGRALAVEARVIGVAVILGPGINMKRSPLCGRNFEYVSEDPWLAGELAITMVQGIQSLGVGTSVKHFAANNQEHDRLRVSAEVDERTLREIYLPAFERTVKIAQPWTVMCAYNKINGVYCSEHHWLLTEILRDEWGFEGLVVSDWGAVADRVAALAAGLDLEMPPNLEGSPPAVIAAIREGQLDESVLDASVRRVLNLVNLAQPTVVEGGTFDADEHHRLAHRAALESAVLLKNDGNALPLRPESGSRVALIGEFARTPRYQGAGSSQVNPTRIDKLTDELADRFGSEVEITFAAGFGIDSTEKDDALRTEAVAAARGADHVVVCLGLPASAESEGFDRTHMDLPANQLALVEALAEVSDRLIVILANGSAVTLSTWERRAAAILECWLSGQAAAGAAADLITGAATPSGKLAETLPMRLADNSSYFNFPGENGVVRYGEGLFIGYRGYDKAEQQVSYPFGFGLSYTTFEVGDLQVTLGARWPAATWPSRSRRRSATPARSPAPRWSRSMSATSRRASTGRSASSRRSGRCGSSRARARRSTMTLDSRSFAYWSVVRSDWVVEAGDFEIAIGTSSRHLAATEVISLAAPSVAGPIGTNSSLEEWLADPRGRELIHGLDSPVIKDPELVKIIGNMPMNRLSAFGAFGFNAATLEQMTQQLTASER